MWVNTHCVVPSHHLWLDTGPMSFHSVCESLCMSGDEDEDEDKVSQDDHCSVVVTLITDTQQDEQLTSTECYTSYTWLNTPVWSVRGRAVRIRRQ